MISTLTEFQRGFTAFHLVPVYSTGSSGFFYYLEDFFEVCLRCRSIFRSKPTIVGFQRVLAGFYCFFIYWFFCSFTIGLSEFSRHRSGFIVLTWFNQVIPSSNGFLLGFTGCFFVNDRLKRVFEGPTGFYRMY